MAGRETVTITEFSNGNGSADGQACSEEWVGVGWWLLRDGAWNNNFCCQLADNGREVLTIFVNRSW